MPSMIPAHGPPRRRSRYQRRSPELMITILGLHDRAVQILRPAVMGLRFFEDSPSPVRRAGASSSGHRHAAVASVGPVGDFQITVPATACTALSG
jgi:hypothetical protein